MQLLRNKELSGKTGRVISRDKNMERLRIFQGTRGYITWHSSSYFFRNNSTVYELQKKRQCI